MAISLLFCSALSLLSARPAVDSPFVQLLVPAYSRPYDSVRGGVQIVAVAFDQKQNFQKYGFDDEFVVLKAKDTLPTKGWILDAADGQRFPLPDTIYKTLTVYTHQQLDPYSNKEYSLGYHKSKWIWNNDDPDTATLYDEHGNAIDKVTFIGKEIKKQK